MVNRDREIEIHGLNTSNWNFLQFDAILQSNKRGVFDRIVTKHIFRKYVSYFTGKSEYLETYLGDVFLCIQECVLSPEKLTTKNIEKLYMRLFSFFGKKGYGYRNRGHTDVKTFDENGKYVNYTHSQYILREMEVALLQFHEQKTQTILSRIFTLCIGKMRSTIHPFPDNNFLFASILMDILLIKNKYLPIEYKNTMNDSQVVEKFSDPLYMEDLFFEIVREKYKNYHF